MKSKYKNWKTNLILGVIFAIIGFCLLSVSKAIAIFIMAVGVILALSGSTGKKKYQNELKENEKYEKDANERREKYNALRAAKIKEFSERLAAISRVDIIVSEEKAKRRQDKPYPKLSNITAKTDINNLFPLVVVDVETTGHKPQGNDIIEVSAIKYSKPFIPESCFTTLCKPRNAIPEDASKVNGITDDMVEDAPSFAEIAKSLSEYMKGCTFVGQFLEFDATFLHACGAELPEGKYFDTCDLARHTIKGLSNYKLGTICDYFDIFRDVEHRSLSDAYATALVFEKLIDEKRS